jgi:hypothetical protein
LELRRTFSGTETEYRYSLRVTSTGLIQAHIWSVVANVATLISANVNVPGIGTYVAGDVLWFEALASGTTIESRVWRDGTARPAVPTRTVVDSSIASGAGVAILFGVPVGTAIVTIDDFSVYSGGTGWGSADTGGAWTSVGGLSPDYDVNGSAGTIANLTAVSRRTYLNVTNQHCLMRFKFNLSVVPDSGLVRVLGMVRQDGTALANGYLGGVDIYSSGVINAMLQKRVAGVITDIVAVDPGLGSYAAGQWLWVEFLSVSSVLEVRVWRDGQARPANDSCNVLDTSIAGSGTYLGMYSYMSAATNSPVTSVDDLSMINLTGWGTPAPVNPGAWDHFSTGPWMHLDGSVGRFIATLGSSGAGARVNTNIGAHKKVVTCFSIDRLPTTVGQNFTLRHIPRYVDASNLIRTYCLIRSTGVVAVYADKVVAGVTTSSIGVQDPVAGITYAPGDKLWFRSETVSTSIRVWVWKDGTPMPMQPTMTCDTAGDISTSTGGTYPFVLLMGSLSGISSIWGKVYSAYIQRFNGWGTPNTGPAWTLTNTSMVDSTNGYNVVTPAQGGIDLQTTLTSPDSEILCCRSLDSLPTTAGQAAGWYHIQRLNSALTVQCRLEITNTGVVQTALTTSSFIVANTQTVPGIGTYVVGDKLWMRSHMVGTIVRVKVWRDGTTEPVSWTRSADYAAVPSSTSTSPGGKYIACLTGTLSGKSAIGWYTYYASIQEFSDTWGAADVGGNWRLLAAGSSPYYQVGSGYGSMYPAGSSAFRLQALDVPHGDVALSYRFQVNEAVATESSVYVRSPLPDFSQSYRFDATVGTGGVVSARILYDGVSFAFLTTVPGFGTYVFDQDWIRCLIRIEGKRVRFFVWKDGTQPPVTPVHDIIHDGRQNGTSIGFAASTGTTVFQGPVRYDDIMSYEISTLDNALQLGSIVPASPVIHSQDGLEVSGHPPITIGLIDV